MDDVATRLCCDRLPKIMSPKESGRSRACETKCASCDGRRALVVGDALTSKIDRVELR